MMKSDNNLMEKHAKLLYHFYESDAEENKTQKRKIIDKKIIAF